MKKFLIIRSHGGFLEFDFLMQGSGAVIRLNIDAEAKGARIKIQPRYKIQYPMKNLCNTNHRIFLTH
jgi:hypothetical protein